MIEKDQTAAVSASFPLFIQKKFEITFDDTQWTKVKKSNQCKQCHDACSDPSALRRHLKTHNGD